MKQRWTWGIVVGVVAILLSGGPQAVADNVSDLEQRVLDLEKQNNELKGMVQDLLTEVRQQKTDVEEVKEVQTQTLKQKAEGLLGSNTKVGGDWRLRGVMFDNNWNYDDDADDSWEFYRMRTRLWLDTQLMDNLRFYFRLANEYKWGIDSKANALLLDPDFDALIGNKELFLDNAFMEWSEPLDIQNLTLKIGRQDLIYGEGFLILDGQSNVGSLAIGFDGVKATWDITEDAKLDLFAMKIEEKRKEKADDEDLYGAYLTLNNVFENHKLETYVLHRNKNGVDDYGLTTPFPDGVLIDPVQHTTALGARMSGAFLDDKSLTYAAEGVFQFGELEDVNGFYFPAGSAGQDIDREAYGGYLWGKYTFVDSDWKPYVKLQGVYLSGDDPGSDDYEGFDGFYGEWPQYSEGYIYQLYDPFAPVKGGVDGDLGSWTNLMIARAEVGAKPTEQASVLLAYQHLWADEETGLGDGDERGDMVIGILTYNFNKYLSGHLLGEYFWPDDYYPDGADDSFFTRWQLMLQF